MPTALYMRDIFRTLHVGVRDPFEGYRFSVNIEPSTSRNVSSL